jgi:hypothetical protein
MPVRAAAPVRARTAEPFRPTPLPSVLGSPVAYVIVTTDALVSSFQPLADWKTASGVPTVVRTLSFIRDQYPQAVDDPERIRMFERDAYTRWGTRWVLLGGDTEILPARYAHMTALGDELLASDLYFSCLDGNWNADGDSTWGDGFAGDTDPGDDADLLPEVWVGRAPVVTPVDAQRFVTKTLTYETTPVADAMEQVLFFAEVITPQNWTGGLPQLDGAQIVEQDQLPILDTAPNQHVARLYENYTDARWRPGALRETRAAVIDSLNRGYNIAMHVGHGYREVMSCGDDNLTNGDAGALTNGTRLTNFYAIDCTSNAIDYASIGEALMRSPNGGAVTNIGSTTLDFPVFGRKYQKEYFRILFRDSVTAVGEAQARQKLPYVGSSYFDGFDRLSQLSLLLLGDPELRIFTARPRELDVTAPDTVTGGEGAVTIAVATGGSPLAGARVTLWMPGHEYRSGLTDLTGSVTLPFHPDTVGACSLTVTAFNARPARRTLQVVPGGPPVLQAVPPLVFDDPQDGRTGDNDGVADAGETVDLEIDVRNAGGSDADAVTGTLLTSDPWVTVLEPAAEYATIAAGDTRSPATLHRITIAAGAPDAHEAAFTLALTGDGGLAQQQEFRVTLHAPRLVHAGHAESEPSGNGDGRPQPGETATYAFTIRNEGSAEAHGLTGHFRSLDGLATVVDSTFTLPDLAPDSAATSVPLQFMPLAPGALLQLEVDDANGPRLSAPLDLDYPGPVSALAARGGSGQVVLSWLHAPEADLAGYQVFRATSAAGPYTPVGPGPAGRTSTWTDGSLAPLTTYWYEVAAVDSSGNVSAPGPPTSSMTGPAEHAGFPVFTRETSDTPVGIAARPGGADLVIGGLVPHLFHADGTAPVDADGLASTPGDLTTQGTFYTGGASFADLDGDGGRDVVAAAWTSQKLIAVDGTGTMRPGFPISIGAPTWSGVAIGDLDGDGHPELVLATLDGAILAFHANGTEVRDGDANPATIGVFKRITPGFHPGTPALADVTGSGHLAIVYGGGDGFIYAWNADGTNVPGFPVNLFAGIFGSVAVGRLDGPASLPSIVAPVGNNSIKAVRADGTFRFSVSVPTTGLDHAPSPALADMNGDGFADIVVAALDGRILVVDRNGAAVAPWTPASRFSVLTSEAVLGSPVVADIDGDGHPDVVVGDENGSLAALSGATGAMLPGFPIALAAEASGTPALCDCDGDGMTEIATVDYGGTLHLWDYDHPFSPGGPPPWPQFHHDARRTGSSEALSTVGVPAPDAAPRALELAMPRPNPARGPVEIAFGIPAERNGAALDVAVFDAAGRRVRTLAHETARAARGTLRWDGRDAHGTRVAAGLYFVRLDAGAGPLTRKLVVLP